jgi:hypothetical protein
MLKDPESLYDRSILPRVDAEFRQLLVAGAHPAYCIDARTARIVDEREQFMGSHEHGYILVSVQRHVRNDHGEYYFFLSEGSGKPVFRHVPQATARAVLKKKYIAPGAP